MPSGSWAWSSSSESKLAASSFRVGKRESWSRRVRVEVSCGEMSRLEPRGDAELKDRSVSGPGEPWEEE